MKSMKAKKSSEADRIESLDRCYGKIGIPAVAAAVRYQSDATIRTYAAAASRPTRRGKGEAA